MRRIRPVLAALAALALLLGACGDSDDDANDDETSAEADGGSDSGSDDGEDSGGLDPEFVELFQEQLQAVGCYDGPIDGIDGAGTMAAISAFQAAKGLTQDGIVGSETETALAEAVEAGETVCDEPADADDGGGALDGDESGDANDGGGALDGAQIVTVSAASFANDFDIDMCSLEPDLLNGFVTGSNDADLTIEIEVLEGEGSFAVDGGNEQDGITLNGDVESFSTNEARDFSGSGTFTAPNFEGEEFTFSGSCPE